MHINRRATFVQLYINCHYVVIGLKTPILRIFSAMRNHKNPVHTRSVIGSNPIAGTTKSPENRQFSRDSSFSLAAATPSCATFVQLLFRKNLLQIEFRFFDMFLLQMRVDVSRSAIVCMTNNPHSNQWVKPSFPALCDKIVAQIIWRNRCL